MAKYYIEILNIAKESADAKKLLNYRAPHTAKQVWYNVYCIIGTFNDNFNLAVSQILPNQSHRQCLRRNCESIFSNLWAIHNAKCSSVCVYYQITKCTIPRVLICVYICDIVCMRVLCLRVCVMCLHVKVTIKNCLPS